MYLKLILTSSLTSLVRSLFESFVFARFLPNIWLFFAKIFTWVLPSAVSDLPLSSSQSSCGVRFLITLVQSSIIYVYLSNTSETVTRWNFLHLSKQHWIIYLIFWMFVHHSFYSNTSFLRWQTSFVSWNLKEKTFFDTFLVLWFQNNRPKFVFNINILK